MCIFVEVIFICILLNMRLIVCELFCRMFFIFGRSWFWWVLYNAGSQPFKHMQAGPPWVTSLPTHSSIRCQLYFLFAGFARALSVLEPCFDDVNDWIIKHVLMISILILALTVFVAFAVCWFRLCSLLVWCLCILHMTLAMWYSLFSCSVTLFNFFLVLCWILERLGHKLSSYSTIEFVVC